MEKSPEAFRTIREVAEAMEIPQHVLRFWETRFPQIRPLKRAGGRRYYRPEDVERLKLIKRLLYDEGYTIKGVQKLFKEQGVQNLATAAFDARLVFAAEAPASEEQDDYPAPGPDGATEPEPPLAAPVCRGARRAARGSRRHPRGAACSRSGPSAAGVRLKVGAAALPGEDRAPIRMLVGA
jgi:DNA-binding transcriptional MerR regulator